MKTQWLVCLTLIFSGAWEAMAAETRLTAANKLPPRIQDSNNASLGRMPIRVGATNSVTRTISDNDIANIAKAPIRDLGNKIISPKPNPEKAYHRYLILLIGAGIISMLLAAALVLQEKCPSPRVAAPRSESAKFSGQVVSRPPKRKSKPSSRR